MAGLSILNIAMQSSTFLDCTIYFSCLYDTKEKAHERIANNILFTTYYDLMLNF